MIRPNQVGGSLGSHFSDDLLAISELWLDLEASLPPEGSLIPPVIPSIIKRVLHPRVSRPPPWHCCPR